MRYFSNSPHLTEVFNNVQIWTIIKNISPFCISNVAIVVDTFERSKGLNVPEEQFALQQELLH